MHRNGRIYIELNKCSDHTMSEAKTNASENDELASLFKQISDVRNDSGETQNRANAVKNSRESLEQQLKMEQQKRIRAEETLKKIQQSSLERDKPAIDNAVKEIVNSSKKAGYKADPEVLQKHITNFHRVCLSKNLPFSKYYLQTVENLVDTRKKVDQIEERVKNIQNRQKRSRTSDDGQAPSKRVKFDDVYSKPQSVVKNEGSLNLDDLDFDVSLGDLNNQGAPMISSAST